MFDELYAQILARLQAQQPEDGFNLEDLFTKEEWAQIGSGADRQRFGSQFARDVKDGAFPSVTRNEQPNEPGGNEARYNY